MVAFLGLLTGVTRISELTFRIAVEPPQRDHEAMPTPAISEKLSSYVPRRSFWKTTSWLLSPEKVYAARQVPVWPDGRLA